MNLMKNEWFPFVTKNIKDKHGWDTFYYGNVSTGGRGGRGRGGARGGAPGRGGGRRREARARPAAARRPRRRRSRSARPRSRLSRASGPRSSTCPRFHNNYVGLRNRFALLSEAYAYATFEDRIKATNYFVEEALNFASANADRLKKAVEAADKESIVGKVEGTRAQMKRGGMVEILMGEVEEEKNPNNGAVMNRRKDVIHPEQMMDMLWFEPSSTEDVPTEYYVPAGETKAIELLRTHGIQMRQVAQPVRGVEQFVISGNTQQPVRNGSIDSGSHGLRVLEGAWQAAPASVTVPAGAWVVEMNQPLARLAFYLLAPTSDDGLTAWNVLDDSLGADAKAYPILRKK